MKEPDCMWKPIFHLHIYVVECFSVCLFAMRSVPVIANVTKLSMALLNLEKGRQGFAGPGRWIEESFSHFFGKPCEIFFDFSSVRHAFRHKCTNIFKLYMKQPFVQRKVHMKSVRVNKKI